MAQIFPSDIEAVASDRYENDEHSTLLTLRDGLSDDFSVYHSVHWSKANKRHTAFGEIDFVIVNKAGHVLVIEQKNGPMHETEQGLEKHYSSGPKLVHSQVQRNIGVFRDKFKGAIHRSASLNIEYLIYCPDHRVIDVNAAGVDMSRTVDATSMKSLSDRVVQLLATESDDNAFLAQELHDFLLSSFRIAPDVNAYKSNQKRVYRHLLDGLSEVIENLEFEPFRLRVVGTAGSGKTQVTMRFCDQALSEDLSPLMLCFNRRLADKLTAQAPDGVTVNTYHGFCHEMAKLVGIELNFKKADEPGFWRKIQEQLVGADLSVCPKFDCLVVDEGQDFKEGWYDIIQLFLADDSTQLWLEDPLQNLRSTDPVPLPGFVTYHETANFRTPAIIAEFIKGVLESDFEQRNMLPGLGVAMFEYEKDVELQKVLNSRVNDLAKKGFDASDIVIISCHGMNSTALANIEQVGKFKVRRFTGEYDSNNEQIYTEGEINFDSIFRFKGEQAPAVILVDLDENLERNDWATGILYCAMTRATIRLELVVQKKCPWIDVFRENLDDE